MIETGFETVIHGALDMRYDTQKLRQALQDEYMAAMVVGFTEDTPSLTDLEYATDEWLVEEAKRQGYNMREFELAEDEGGSKDGSSRDAAASDAFADANAAGSGSGFDGFQMDQFMMLYDDDDDDNADNTGNADADVNGSDDAQNAPAGGM